MNTIYKRVENIDEKIHSVKLPYVAWKVLFLVNGELTVGEIVSTLEEEETVVNEVLEKLSAEELILAEKAKQPEKKEEKKPKAKAKAEETAPPVEEAPAPKEEKSEPEVSKTTPEKPAEEVPVMEEKPQEASKPEPAVTDMEDTGMDLDMEFGDDLAVEEPPKQEKEKAAAPPAEEKAETTIEGGQKTILVVDDSIVIRKMVEIALEDENLNIQTAVSGKEGLDKMDQLNPDLLILDLMLPDISGIDILKTVKASKGIPVIMLSGKDSPQMVENAKSEGADAFLPKPFKDDELVEKIKSLLQG